MTKQELITSLRQLRDSTDHEMAHGVADDLLLQYIDDKEVELAYNEIEKWYA